MYKASIKNVENVETNAAQFETEQEVKSWVFDNSEYFPEGHTVIITDITAEKKQQEESNEAKAYLASTDWYAIRKSETAKEIPADVLSKRADARLKITKE